jgi:hypothetical protein
LLDSDHALPPVDHILRVGSNKRANVHPHHLSENDGPQLKRRDDRSRGHLDHRRDYLQEPWDGHLRGHLEQHDGEWQELLDDEDYHLHEHVVPQDNYSRGRHTLQDTQFQEQSDRQDSHLRGRFDQHDASWQERLDRNFARIQERPIENTASLVNQGGRGRSHGGVPMLLHAPHRLNEAQSNVSNSTSGLTLEQNREPLLGHGNLFEPKCTLFMLQF